MTATATTTAPTAAPAEFTATLSTAKILDAVTTGWRIVKPAARSGAATVDLTAVGGNVGVGVATIEGAYAATVPAPGARGRGRITVPLSTLTATLRAVGRRTDIIAALAADTVRVTDDDGVTDAPILTLTAATAAGTITYRIPTVPDGDRVTSFAALPDTDDTRAIVVNSRDLSVLARATVAASTDWSLPILTGIRLVADDGAVRATCTDRYRAADQTVGASAGTLDVLVPADRFTAAAAAFTADTADDPVVVSVGATSVVLSNRARSVRVRTLDGKFPAVGTLIDAAADGATAAFTGPAANIATAVRRVTAANPRGEWPVTMYPGDDAVVITNNLGVESFAAATTTVTGVTHGGGHPAQFSANPKFLAAGARVFGDAVVTVAGRAAEKPWLFTADDLPGFRYLLMPVRRAEG